MRSGSLFAGIGGFDLGFQQAGIETVWQVENDPDCNSVLERHWPHVKRYGDVCDVGKSNLEPVDLVCGGFPCQDVSLAGNRAGLSGERSGLFWQAHRILAELHPAYFVIENVPGLYSSKRLDKKNPLGEDTAVDDDGVGSFLESKDFGIVINALVDIGYCVAWRCLDAEYFGVAQRRRRVFFVGCLGDRTRAAEILLEPESSPGDTPPSREAGQRIAGTLESGTNRTGGTRPPGSTVDNCQDLQVVKVTDPVNDNIIAHSLGSRCPGERQEAEATYVVRIAQTGSNGWGVQEDVPHALDSASASQVVAFAQNTRDEVRLINGDGAIVGALAAQPGMKQQSFVAHCLRAEGADASEDGTGRGTPLVAFTQNQVGDVLTGDVFPAMGTNSNASGRNTPKVNQGMAVRRLTPRECERLQGFPDGWTAHDDQGKPISDSARYRMLGNAVCVNVSRWIGKRIVAALAGKRE